jgi:hypothetical protein
MEEGSSKVKYIYYTQEDYDEAKSCQTMICVSFTVTLCYVVNTLLAIARYVPCVYLHWIHSDDIMDFEESTGQK